MLGNRRKRRREERLEYRPAGVSSFLYAIAIYFFEWQCDGASRSSLTLSAVYVSSSTSETKRQTRTAKRPFELAERSKVGPTRPSWTAELFRAAANQYKGIAAQ